MEPLDTHVEGDPDAINASADAFDRYGDRVDSTGDSLVKVNGRRERAWHGPASDACGGPLVELRQDADNLAPQVRSAARAARDLAGAIKAVKDKMRQAMDVAHGAQLQVDGEFIVPPSPPGPAPPPPKHGPLEKCEANGAASQAAKDQSAHQQACQQYNQKMEAFKKAKGLVDQAREQEKNAHHEYDAKTGEVTSVVDKLKSIGSTGVAWALSYVSAFHGAANECFAKAEDYRQTGGMWAQAHAKVEDMKGAKRAKYVKWVPNKAKDVIAKNPTNTFKKTFDEGGKFLKWSKPLAKGIPFVGTAWNATSHGIDAATGKESWGKAAAHFGAETAGGAAGGALAGAALGSVVPGVGTVIGGVVGGIGGSIGADSVVDWLWGD